MQRKIIFILASLVLLTASGLGPASKGRAGQGPSDKLELQIEITQDLELIKNSLFGEPPTFAIWLEDQQTGKAKTVFVTYRAGTGDWAGKPNCYAALPRWYQVFREETGFDGYPTKGHEAPDAVTGATPKKETFTVKTTLPAGSRWTCYVEMNLSGDFNDDYLEFNDETFEIDEHKSGQPPLLFRSEVIMENGRATSFELYRKVHFNEDGDVFLEPVDDKITSASRIFSSVKSRVSD